MYSVLFTKQDSLGLKSWSSFAAEAGVADTAWFGRCLGDTTVEREIDEGRDLGEQLSIIGTPTVFLNGQRYSRPPREEELLDLVRSLVGGTVAR
jgi:protein-disulfide isomerase